ncbi:hypothetical protein JNB88_30395 [Rhizobium cauense]|uniref:hypothetical protein n=1 Tax=Rhizobium cauense TaxID=1166683 RepID=UPI0012E0B08C|nr:hypothetical protein [Rhizobium cauense]
MLERVYFSRYFDYLVPQFPLCAIIDLFVAKAAARFIELKLFLEFSASGIQAIKVTAVHFLASHITQKRQ